MDTSNENSDEIDTLKAVLKISEKDGVPKVYCPVCNKAIRSLVGYVKHVKKHEPPGGFLCRYCDARYCSDEQLKQHLEKVHITIVCRVCKDSSLTFSNEEDYRIHVRDIHNGIDREMYKCEKCGAEYKTLAPFKRHVATECGTIKPHQCDQCPMSFVTVYNLKQHKELHKGIKKFCCSYCGKDFLQKVRLVEHERRHTGEKPYKCDVCGKCFAHRESIVTHSSIHTGVRLVECRCCSSRFSCYSNLIKHRRTRPDTCGLPEYDPLKRRRHCGSRIPATLNPTSEIKVSNMNKIIKEHHMQKTFQEDCNNRKPVSKVSRRSPNKKPVKKRTKLKTKLKIDGKRHNSVDRSDYDNDHENSKTKNRRSSTRTQNLQNSKNGVLPILSIKLSHSIGAKRKPIWSDSDSNENRNSQVIDVMSDSNDDYSPTEGNKQNLMGMAQIKKEHLSFEIIDSKGFDSEDLARPTYINTKINEVKDESHMCLLNEKNKIDDMLLNEANPETLGNSTRTTPKVKLEQPDELNETEMVFVKNEIVDGLSDVEEQEDVLLMNAEEFMVNDCKIVLNDITKQYPQLKEVKSVTVATGRKTKANISENECDFSDRTEYDRIKNTKNRKKSKTVRKYRKRCEIPVKERQQREHKRVATLTAQELKQRLQMMRKESRSWQCPHCIKIYYIKKPFERHLSEDHQMPHDQIKNLMKNSDDNMIHEGEVFKCHICDKIYLLEKRLMAHIRLHGEDGKLIHKCSCYCNLFFASKAEVKEHAKTEHRDLIYCIICEIFLPNPEALRNHKKRRHSHENMTLTDENGTLATTVSRKASENANLDSIADGNLNDANCRPNKMPQHTRKEKNKERNLVCDKCGKKFSCRTPLSDHVRSDCGRKPLYQCNVCGKHLTTAGILKTHQLLHKDDTPYQCDKCGKTFKVKAQYKTHIKTRHTDNKPFKCHLCPKEYPYRESLLTHMSVHTGLKRFMCNGCGKRFTCISNLQAHRKVQAATCGQLPLNAKATQYMGVQKGNLLLGAKPEAGVDYKETNTLLAKEVIDRDLPMAQEPNYPSISSETLVTVPLNQSGTIFPQIAPEIVLGTQPFPEGSQLNFYE